MEKPLAWIIGDTGGLGKHLLKETLGAGYRVIGISRRADAPEGSDYRHIQADITEGTDTCVGQMISTHGIPALLIQGAGAFVDKPLARTTDEDIERMLAVNFIAPMQVIRALLPHYQAAGAEENMRRNRSIINIGSAGMRPDILMQDSRDIALYGGTKAALATASIGLSKELGVLGVRLNVIAPTYFTGNEEKARAIARTCIEAATGALTGRIL